MALVKAFVEATYEITDDLDKRFRDYGTTDLGACVAIDLAQNPISLLAHGCHFTRFELDVVEGRVDASVKGCIDIPK